MTQLQLHKWDISYKVLHELGTIKVEDDENSCQVNSDDTIVGMSSPNHVFAGDATIVEVGACEDSNISIATYVLVEPSNEEFSNMHAVLDVCYDDSTLVIADEVSYIVTVMLYYR